VQVGDLLKESFLYFVNFFNLQHAAISNLIYTGTAKASPGSLPGRKLQGNNRIGLLHFLTLTFFTQL
jgi:hypothetical protein